MNRKENKKTKKMIKRKSSKNNITEDLTRAIHNGYDTTTENNRIIDTNNDTTDFTTNPLECQNDTQECIERTERKLFSYEERQEILKSSQNKCACCGKKLTTKTLTIEHIIPIYRGGTNEKENLTALCYTCNQDKSDKLYLPRSFYSALMCTPRVNEMDDMVRTWFKNNKERHDIERYPLIAPKHNTMLDPIRSKTHRYTKPTYNRQLIVTWTLITAEDYEEVEAISGVNLKVIRNFLEKVRPEATESEKHLYPHYEIYKPVTFYALRKLSNDKLLALFALRYDKDTKDMAIYVIWTDVTKAAISMITSNFINCAFDAITNIADEEIKNYIIFSYKKETFDYYRHHLPQYAPWDRAEEIHYLDTITEEIMYVLIVYVEKNQAPLSVSNYIDIPKWLEEIQ